jgi:hypothetical protein
VLRLAVLAVLIVSALAAPPAAYGVTLGMADDPTLVRSGTPDALLDVGQQHNVGIVRVIASEDRDAAQYVTLAENLRARGMTLHATLALPWGSQDTVAPARFAEWAAGMAATLQATGVDLRVSLLNEPDWTLPAADECGTPEAVQRVVRSAGSRAVTSTTSRRVRVPRTKVVRRVVRRHGRRVVVSRRVAVTRRVRVRRRAHGRTVTSWRTVPVYRWALRATSTVSDEATDSYATDTTLTPRRECFAITRARIAGAYLRAAVPAVRAAAPGVPVVIGETSPNVGVVPFVAELGRQGVPAVDGWADHPYGLWAAQATADAVRAAFGSLTLDWTEFGSPVADGDDAAAALWRQAGALADSLGVRALVAYQWQHEDDHAWDTSLLDPGMADTGRAQAFSALAR